MSFARAIADDLRATASFERVVFLKVGEPTAGPLELRGEIRRTAECLAVTLPGAMLGPRHLFFWLVPVPTEQFTAQLEVDLRLVDDRSGAVVWQTTLEGFLSKRVGRYTRMRAYGRDELDDDEVPTLGGDAGVDRTSIFQWEFELLRRGMLDARPPLIEAAQRALRP